MRFLQKRLSDLLAFCYIIVPVEGKTELRPLYVLYDAHNPLQFIAIMRACGRILSSIAVSFCVLERTVE